ncbi:hypothetical protein KDL01_41775, partial [Actinospica durhamensis]
SLMASGPEPLQSYLTQHFGAFDFAGAVLPHPDTTVTGHTSFGPPARHLGMVQQRPDRVG